MHTIQRVLETPRIKELLSRFPPFNLDLTLPRELTPEARNGVHLVAIALNADKPRAIAGLIKQERRAELARAG